MKCGNISGRQQFRALLEALKWLSMPEVLQARLLCRQWLQVCDNDEVWLHLLTCLGFSGPIPTSAKTAYQEAYRQCVVVIERTAVCRYYPGYLKWQQTQLQAQLKSPVQSVLVDKDRLFCCTGDPRCLFLHFKTGVTQLTSTMPTYRTDVGLCALDSYVYALCGVDSNVTSVCERFEVQTEHWEALPPAIRRRKGFNPAVHQTLIYLSGGCTSAIETFNPASFSFTLLPVTSQNILPTISLIIQDVLYVFNTDLCFWLNCKTGQHGVKICTLPEFSESATQTLAWDSQGFIVVLRKGERPKVWQVDLKKMNARSVTSEIDSPL